MAASCKLPAVSLYFMQDYEKLGAFYLGCGYDLERKQRKEKLLLYDSKDLVTHAVCVGMTGSGKTGLCIGLLEEAAIDGIPAIVIDPKGDLSNLLLTFPDLKPGDFRPWINEDDARRAGLDPDAFAAQQAGQWREGLAEWSQDGERIRKLRESADIAVYTPGSNAGLPVSVMKSFAAPAAGVREDRELFRDRVSGTVSSLLGLAGIDADPIQSREHILLSTIFGATWEKGDDLDLAAIIRQIQSPPFSRVGVMDLDSFYPAKDRFGLAMALNNLIASPGFEAWLEGEALDIDALLHTSQGKPRISIFSVAHLSDAERMFFVSLLLNQMLAWVRAQSGTTSLRAILYMDEIFGYFPPVANPPSKRPLLTLLKQARAFGLGIVLATQNPVDLDYKGLANTGTWFVGRLQTERDKARLMDGLQSAAGESGAKFDRGRMERALSALGSRVFLMNNVHEDAPEVFESRWTMSYLRGPLARNQIQLLMAGRKTVARAGPAASGPKPQATAARPVLPPEIPQYFVPVRGSLAGPVSYQPALLGIAQVHFIDAKTGVDEKRDVIATTPVDEEAVAVNWDEATELDIGPDDLEKEPAPKAGFAELPSVAANPKNYTAWTRDFSSWVFRMQKLDLFRCDSLDALSKLGESERDFRVRLQQAAREERDRRAEELKKKFAPKLAALAERRRKAEQAVDREKGQAQQQTLQTAVSVGTALLGAFLGRKTLSMANLNRAATVARAAGRSRKEAADVERAGETVEAVQAQIDELNAAFKAEVDALQSKVDPATEPLETVTVRPKKTNVTVRLVALGWIAATSNPL
jgi:hypothetical protein